MATKDKVEAANQNAAYEAAALIRDKLPAITGAGQYGELTITITIADGLPTYVMHTIGGRKKLADAGSR